MELESAARELYALPPGEFTAARNAMAKAAKQDGDQDLAAQLKALPKPSASAWLVNMLALHRPDAVDSVVRLGRELGEAQEQLDPRRLQQLGGQRRELLAEVAGQARGLAEQLRNPVGAAAVAEAEQTLHAAMADPDAAAAVASGLLTGPLMSNGIDPVDLDGKLAVPGAAGIRPPAGPGRPARPVTKAAGRAKGTGGQEQRQAEEAARLRRRAQAEAERAEQRLGRAEAKQQRIQDRLDELSDRREELDERIAGLRRQIAALEREASGVEQEERAAEAEAEAAAVAVIRAEEAARQARSRLESGS